MELKESVKEQFEDGKTFLNYIKYHIFDDIDDPYETNINDLDFLDGHRLVKDNPKVIKLKEIFEPKILKKMKEYFVESDEDLTKRNVRKYISGYNKFGLICCNCWCYFFTDDEKDNLLIEWFENDLGEILLLRDVVNDGGHELYLVYIDVIFHFIDEFCEEMLSSDIKTITKKLIQTL